ncbi:hypothetical protein Ciccas_008176 [Cichlidogyrus casuarinus]|uniref:ADP-ribosylation factor n=1 Tax=Cichlidogyrus casuarinus TaxID=1844966 RepID=A0ABD2Q0P4_9PLAT
MGLVNSAIKRLSSQENSSRILMLGLDSAGKTTILYRMKLGAVIQTLPTVGFNVETVRYKNLVLTVWDVGGQERIRRLWKHYFNEARAVIFVVDSSDPYRLDEATSELFRVAQEPELHQVPILVYANKSDRSDAVPYAYIADKMSLCMLGDDRPWYIQPSCALDGKGITEGLEWLSNQVVKSGK